MSLEELLQAARSDQPILAAGETRSGCVVGFTNGCPPEWGAVIINVGAKFWFQDPGGTITGDQVVSKNTNLTSGQSDQVSSREGCVRIVLAACTVSIKGQTKVLQNTTQGDAQHCLLHVPLFVGPKRRLAQGSAELPLELTVLPEAHALGVQGGPSASPPELFPTPRPELSAMGIHGAAPPLIPGGPALRGAWWWYTDAYEYYSGAWHYAGRIQNPNYSNVVNAANNWVAGHPGYRTYTPNPPQQIWVP